MPKLTREEYYNNSLILPPECDVLCPYRPCYNKYENKGSFSPGYGYTSYASTFQPACGTRLNSGCPDWRNEAGDEVDLVRALDAGLGLMENHAGARTKRDKAKRQRGKDIIQAGLRLLKKKL